MFRLPVSNESGIAFILDSSAVSLLSALLSDDLDDRADILGKTLRSDPLLACWSVQEASWRDNVLLSGFEVAARWLDQRLLDVAFSQDASEKKQQRSFVHAQNLSQEDRRIWDSIALTSIRASRIAAKLADRFSASPHCAAWYALLCCTKRQLGSLSTISGQSFDNAWVAPAWLEEWNAQLEQSVEPIAVAAFQAIESTSSMSSSGLSNREAEELTMSLPDAQRIVPLMLEKLQRLEQLESHFTLAVHREKMAAMQQLAYGASHEINNPLANISTRAQALMQNEQDAGRRRKLLAINNQAFRAYEMIADLMLFAKPPKLEMQWLSIHSLLEQIRSEIETMSNGKPVICQIRSSQEALRISGDPNQLAVAIKAICVNGIEAMGGHGELFIEVTQPNGSVVEISVEDSGEGLNELAQRHLFDPFFSGREAGRGMGFGLSKAWRIVELHHGRIRVRSVPSRGSRFTITLPVRKPATVELPDADI